jgi:ATP-dependent Clp protease ATP-binding subunit ClpB
MGTTTAALDPTVRSPRAEEFEAALRSRIVGQDDGVRALADLYQVFCAGLNPRDRPVANLLFLGPTGSGKTRLVEAAAEVLLGTPQAVLKIDCAEFQHSHEIAKLLGSPPGYLGHRETHPLITQEALCQHHTEQVRLSFVLFDEIEKASDALWQLLLGMMDKATLTLGDNRRVDLSQSMIILTSNLGGAEINELIAGGMGFVQPPPTPTIELDGKVQRTAVEAAKRRFSPEFLNRIDKLVVFHPLRPEQLDQILGIELAGVQRRVLDTGHDQFLFQTTPAARAFLLREGTDIKYGARHLKRAIERYIVYPIANLLATRQLSLGDLLLVDWDDRTQCLVFRKEEAAAALIVPDAAADQAQVARAGSGRAIQFPSTAKAHRASGNEV